MARSRSAGGEPASDYTRALGSLRFDGDRRLVEANAEAARLFGFASPAELLDAVSRGALLGPLHSRDPRWTERLTARGPMAFEAELGRRDGGSWRCRITTLPARDEAGLVALLDEVEPPGGPDDPPARDFLDSLINALPNPLFVKDAHHRWVILNESACSFMGRRRDELLGRSDDEFFPAAEAEVFWAKDDDVFRSGETNENEERFTDASGRVHVIVTRKTIHTDAKGQKLLLGVITDITERKQIEEELRRSRDQLDRRVAERTLALEEANRLLTLDIAEREKAEQTLREAEARKNEFLALLGHELRNPLTPIRTAVALMRRIGRAEPTLRRAQEIIDRQVTQMTRLIDDLLDVSRVSRGKILLRKERLDLVQVVRAALSDRQGSLEAHGLTLEDRLTDRPLVLFADPARLAQAIGNLLDNAEKFTDPGGRIIVTVEPDAAGNEARLAVKDSGIGMANDMMARVFVPFVQAERSASRGRGDSAWDYPW